MPTYHNDSVISLSDSSSTPAVQGESSGFEGVRGISHDEHGGVVGINDFSPSSPPGAGGNGGWFESTQGEGVRGWAKNPNHGGVVGTNTAGGTGVLGTSDGGTGVLGTSNDRIGVWGTSVNFEGIHAETRSSSTAAMAAYQQNPQGTGAGVYAASEGRGPGVFGYGNGSANGVQGQAREGFGVLGTSDQNTGVRGESDSGIGVSGRGGHLAGFFEGNMEVTGNVTVSGDVFLTGADCAENFDVAKHRKVEPGSVMVIDDAGRLTPSERPYDRRVAGVVSGAGDHRPAIILDKREATDTRLPIALVGKVNCKVDARYGPVAVGDLLTTSPTCGHAMRAIDPIHSFGAVIGKALRPLTEGTGLIPVLVALQ